MSSRLRIDAAALDDVGTDLDAQAGFVGSSNGALRAAGSRTYARGSYAALGSRIVAATAGLVSRVEEAFQTCLRAHALAAARIAADLRAVDDDLGRSLPASRPQTDGNHDMAFTGGYGPVSRRPFDPDRAGGPIVRRDAVDARIDTAGVDSVARHLRRFVADGEAMDPPNEGMLIRLRRIVLGELEPTIYDKRFYTHELDEAQRYVNIGLGGDTPLYGDHLHDAWNNVHTASREDYGIADLDNYLPELKP